MERTLILYADDFCNTTIWEQINNALGTNASFDKLTLTVTHAEEGTIEEDEEETEQ